jgi:predicted acyltransferase
MPSASPAPPRLASLDVFRGLTMASMVMVNNQSREGYYQLRHAAWHGWTFTDLIFPSFIWIVGVAMTLSTARRVERGESKLELLRHMVQRAAILFLIGLFLNGFPEFDFAHYRIPGVLQRIAICYLITGVILLYAGLRGRVLWLIGCSALYWVLMAPGGYEPVTNFAAKVDSMFLEGHMYQATKVWDPEGIVSTLPAISNCLFGVLAGMLLRSSLPLAERVVWLLLSGNLLVWLAVILDNVQPINKPIWTVPYALLTSGIASIVFGTAYWLVDGRGYQGWYTRFFTVFGMNAIAVYMFHGLLGDAFGMLRLRAPIVDAFKTFLSAPNAVLAYSLIHVALCFAFAAILYRRRWFLKF